MLLKSVGHLLANPWAVLCYGQGKGRSIGPECSRQILVLMLVFIEIFRPVEPATGAFKEEGGSMPELDLKWAAEDGWRAIQWTPIWRMLPCRVTWAGWESLNLAWNRTWAYHEPWMRWIRSDKGCWCPGGLTVDIFRSRTSFSKGFSI